MENIKLIILDYLKEDINELDMLNMYYDIGKYICDNNVNILDLEIYLKNHFGIVISFTRRNFKNMIKLSKRYNKEELIKLKEYKWIQIIEILSNKKINNYLKDESLNELKKLKTML